MDNEAVQPIAGASDARAARTGKVIRIGLLVVAAGLVCVFAAAFWINPYAPDGTPRTMATHTQLGMPPCNFVVMTSKPCPACGMTTSFALLVRGDVLASMRANWAGTIIAVLWAFTLVWAVASGIAGRTLFIPRGRGELVLTLTVGVVLALVLMRWVGVLISG
ncbi:MAG: hypothetical protein C0467_27280 [Planctomycetaceae bacterium]|nr:hypothetical protein [Planctomycetaceae bacterium]